jgi:hypothetical protein
VQNDAVQSTNSFAELNPICQSLTSDRLYQATLASIMKGIQLQVFEVARSTKIL